MKYIGEVPYSSGMDEIKSTSVSLICLWLVARNQVTVTDIPTWKSLENVVFRGFSRSIGERSLGIFLIFSIETDAKCARKLVRIIMACNPRKILSHKHRLTWCSVLHGRPSCQDKRCGPLFLLQSVNTSARQYKWRCRKEKSVSREETWVGLFRSCSATFEQVLAFGATFCGFSNSEQFLPFWAIFEKNIGLQHIPSTNWSRRFHRKKINTYPVT